MKTSLFFSLACLAITFSSCGQPRKVEETALPTPVFIPEATVTGHWSGDFARDSALLVELDERFVFYDNKRLHDSSLLTCRAIIDLAGPLLEHRYDSTLYEIYVGAFGGLGWNLTEQGRYDEGMQYLHYALDKIKERWGENHIRTAELLVAVAVNYQSRGDLDHALEYIHKSLHVCNQVFQENHRYFGNNYGNLAGMYMLKGDYGQAVFYLNKELENRRAIHKYGQYWTQPILQLNECHIAMNDLEAAEQILDEGFRVLLGTPDWRYHIFTLYLAEAKWRMALGEWEKAREAGLQFLRHYSREAGAHEDTPIPGDGLFLLGQIESRLGRLAEAEDYFRQALASWDAHLGNAASLQISALLEIASLREENGDYQGALEQLGLALGRAIPGAVGDDLLSPPQLEGISANNDILTILIRKSGLLWKAFRRGDGERYLEACWANALATIGYMQASREGFHGQDSKMALSQKAIPLVEMVMACAEEIWKRTGETTCLEQAFQAAEQMKGIVLLETLYASYGRQDAAIPQEVLGHKKQLLNSLAQYDRLIFEEQQKAVQDSLLLHFWHTRRLAVAESRDSLEAALREKYSDYYQSAATIAGVQKRLKRGEALVSYFLGDTSLAVFTVFRNRLHFDRRTWGAREDSLLAGFTHFVNTPPLEWTQADMDDWVGKGHALFETLFPAWDAGPAPASLIVIPDGKLGYLPFHLLPVHNVSGSFSELPYLQKVCTVWYQYSSSLWLQPLASGEKAGIPYAGFAPVYQGAELIASRGSADSLKMAELYPEIVRDGLSKLAFNQPEIKEVAALWGSGGFLGAEATERHFKETGTRARILHLAVHTLTNDQEPLLSQLVFSSGQDREEDGLLHAYELQQLRLSADLTVLSACNTGAGPLKRGEGVMSVSRAFRQAGCPNIAMSLWQANDRSTGEIVSDFFRRLNRGEGKAAALRNASLDYLKNADERYAHPFYWGNMMLIGDDEPLVHRWLWWLLIPALSAAVLLLFYTIRKRKQPVIPG